jgi:ABC-type polysaccharide/polyol phosphate transport system ATPase subunit
MKYAQLIRLLVNRELTLRYKRSVIWLENGHVKMIGNPEEVIAAYEAN